MIAGVPAHVDGRMLADHRRGRRQRRSTRTGCGTTRRASPNWDPIWPSHGIRILPGPRRCGSTPPATACRCRSSPASTPSARSPHIMRDGLRAHLVRADAEDHREGVRAVRLRAEPGPHRQDVRQAARAARGPGAPGAGRGVQASTARTSSSRDDLRALVDGMNRLTDEPLLDLAAGRGRGGRPRPRDGQPVHEGPAGHGDPRRAPLPRRPAHPRGRAAQAARPRRRPADRGAAQHPHPQDARRPPDRPRRAGPRRRRRARARASTPPARWPASAAAACTATARSRAPSSAAASSPAAPPAAPPPPRCADQRGSVQRARKRHTSTIDDIRIDASLRPRGTVNPVICVRTCPRTGRSGIVFRSGVLCVPAGSGRPRSS